MRIFLDLHLPPLKPLSKRHFWGFQVAETDAVGHTVRPRPSGWSLEEGTVYFGVNASFLERMFSVRVLGRTSGRLSPFGFADLEGIWKLSKAETPASFWRITQSLLPKKRTATTGNWNLVRTLVLRLCPLNGCRWTQLYSDHLQCTPFRRKHAWPRARLYDIESVRSSFRY
jgi:hypothetical protein